MPDPGKGKELDPRMEKSSYTVNIHLYVFHNVAPASNLRITQIVIVFGCLYFYVCNALTLHKSTSLFDFNRSNADLPAFLTLHFN